MIVSATTTGGFTTQRRCTVPTNDSGGSVCFRRTAYLAVVTPYAISKRNQSKGLIDSIDRALAEHYGFTDEELDFIINYDIKYRMGRQG